MTAEHDADIAPVAALIGGQTRAAILTALMSGTALAAGELARVAGVSAATASAHLARLLDGGLVEVESQRRHRYYRLAGPQVAGVLEALARISPTVPVRSLRQSRDAATLRRARTCYDHLAGYAGVALCRVFADKGWTTPECTVVTDAGARELATLGIDVEQLRAGRRTLVRPCLDWTERRPHLAGAVGAALLTYLLDAGWLVRVPDRPRALRVTRDGELGIGTTFGVDLAAT